jgi:pyridoxamine 5'-phosphate oxidase
MAEDPIELLLAWLEQARRQETSDPEAMSVATVGRDGRPSLRMVLLRGIDARGLVFYTNLASRKARDLQENPWAALCLHWKSTARQVRIEGRVEVVSETEADDYFAARERESQIGAWASRQSEALANELELEQRVARYREAFANEDVPRPSFWSGYRVCPSSIEFWDKRPSRLHERRHFEREGHGAWHATYLYP